MLRRSGLLASLLFSAVTACGPGATTSLDAAAVPDISGASDIADLAAPSGDLSSVELGADCADDLKDRALGGQCVHRVLGRLVDEAGAAIEGAPVTVCADACFFGKSDAAGSFQVDIDQYIRVELYSLLLHVNPRRAAIYIALPAPVGGVVRFTAPIAALPMPASGPVILTDKSAQTVHGAGVDLFIAAGTTTFFSVEDTGDMPLGSQLRPLAMTDFAKLPLAGAFGAGAAPAVIYGFGPFEVDFRAPVRLAFDNPNAAALPANSAVDVLAQRGLIRGGPPGFRFDVVATAHVSSDGKRIDMDPNTGLDTLTWIALRKKE